MMRKMALVAGVVAVVGIVSLWVAAQEKTAGEMGHSGHMMQMGQGAAEAGKSMAMSTDSMMCPCMGDMKKMGMSDAMAMRHKMLTSSAIASDDPVAVLAVKDDLKLTDEQITKIAAISLKARQDVKAALTDDQKKTLETLAGTPATMKDMCKGMCAKMGMAGAGMSCPMMGKMAEVKAGEGMSCCPMMGAGKADTTKTETK